MNKLIWNIWSVNWLGHESIRMQCVGDTIDDLRDTLNQASTQCDLIITSGGVSMGEWDLVRKIMEEEGDLHFWRVKLSQAHHHCSDYGIIPQFLVYPETQ